MDVGQNNLTFVLNYDNPFPRNPLCVYDIDCPTTSIEEITNPKSTLEGTFDPATYTNIYQTRVKYNCGLGLEFDMGLAGHQEELSRTCQSDGTWSQDMEPCACKLRLQS